MSAQALVSAPWRVNRPSTAWLGLVLLVLAGLGATAADIFSHKPDRWLACTAVAGFFLAFLWAFVMSNMVLLAIDARQLRVPALERGMKSVILLYGLLCVLGSTALLGISFGHFSAIAILIALFCVGGLLFALLPRFVVTPFFLLPAALNAMPVRIELPGPLSTDFVQCWAPVVLGLSLLTLWRWHRLVHVADPYAMGWSRPLVMLFRRGGQTEGWNPWTGFLGRSADNVHKIRTSPDWIQPRADLGDCGPGRSVTSLRIALGGVFMPQTVLSALRTIALIAVPALAYLALMELGHDRRHPVESWQGFWHQGALLALIMVGAFGGMTLALVSLAQLWQRWSKANGELPLLALLPGLGSNVKSQLLAASLRPPLRLQSLLLAFLLALALSLHLSVQATMFVLLGQLGAAGLMVAFSLLIIGGSLPGRWSIGGVGMFGCILICISLFVPVLSDPAAIMLGPLSLRDALLAGWLVLSLILFRLARRGWHGLQQRPHPFLPTSQT